MAQKALVTSVLAAPADITQELKAGWRVVSISPPSQNIHGVWVWTVILDNTISKQQEVIAVNAADAQYNINQELKKGWLVEIQSQQALSPHGVMVWLVVFYR
jgi:hypothetical protein